MPPSPAHTERADTGGSARRITVRGVVQGVGFRPFVFRLAAQHNIRGWVLNDAAGVRIHAEAAPAALDAFTAAIRTQAPPAAVIASIEAVAAEYEQHDSFTIRASDAGPAPTTRISPDLSPCADCLREVRDAADRRAGYAYINCTNCGPRYSIIRSLPYDRPRTTMADWPLCADCRAEYENPADRRYHAQPVACPACGPAFELRDLSAILAEGPDAIARAACMLRDGAILAAKGLGGYCLACDAANNDAVSALRDRKFRKEKPFALLASSLDRARDLLDTTPAHDDLLTSIARPILLAPGRDPARVAPAVAPGTNELGVMLPSTPLHELLFDAGAPDPLVMTSANRASEPICYRDDDALDRLAGLADAFLIGQRPIQHRIDDSVSAVRRGKPFIIRRARGYAPASVGSLATDRPILALGADLKNTIALAVAGEVFLSQHIGDLGDLETDRAFRETIDDLLAMYAINPADLVIAHDLHPEYHSTRAALNLPCAARTAIQHHEAHIASVLLEHAADDPALLARCVVGVALDGTGFGRDRTIWGGEFFVGSVRDGFTRAAHLDPVPMPGGDAAARHPSQAAAAYLADFDAAVLDAPPFHFPPRFRSAQRMIASDLRCTRSTSAGRLFDAAAAVCGFTRDITYEGQAAIWLEQLAMQAGTPPAISFRTTPELIAALVHLRLDGLSAADSAAAFHRALAEHIAATAARLCREHNADTLALSGGVWQNALLDRLVHERLSPTHRVLTHSLVPTNDAGIAAGQAVLSAYDTLPHRSRV